MVLHNAGAALWAAGETDSLETGIDRAPEIVDTGRAKAKLEALTEFTNQCAAFDRDATIFRYGSVQEAISSLYPCSLWEHHLFSFSSLMRTAWACAPRPSAAARRMMSLASFWKASLEYWMRLDFFMK